MDGKQPGNERAPAERQRHAIQQREEKHSIRDMKDDVGHMMQAGAHSVQLHVQQCGTTT